MTRTLEATFDGEALILDEPLDLKPHTRVRVTIEPSGAPRYRAKPPRAACASCLARSIWDIQPALITKALMLIWLASTPLLMRKRADVS